MPKRATRFLSIIMEFLYKNYCRMHSGSPTNRRVLHFLVRSTLGFWIFAYIDTLIFFLVFLPALLVESWAVHRHDLKFKSKSAMRSCKYISQDLATTASFPKSEQRSWLCSPTTHKSSFRCRLHGSSCCYWGKKHTPTPNPNAQWRHRSVCRSLVKYSGCLLHYWLLITQSLYTRFRILFHQR